MKTSNVSSERRRIDRASYLVWGINWYRCCIYESQQKTTQVLGHGMHELVLFTIATLSARHCHTNATCCLDMQKVPFLWLAALASRLCSSIVRWLRPQHCKPPSNTSRAAADA